MPKRASDTTRPDPLRSQLASLVSAPVAPVQEPAAAIEAPPPPKAPRPPAKTAPPQKKVASERIDALTKHTKVMMTQAEVDRNAELSGVVTSAFGSKVTPSQITRVLWSILAEAEDAIRSEARRAPKDLVVPSKGDHIGMGRYEGVLAQFLVSALKRS